MHVVVLAVAPGSEPMQGSRGTRASAILPLKTTAAVTGCGLGMLGPSTLHRKDVWHTAAARLTEAETRTECEDTGKERVQMLLPACKERGQFSLVNEAIV